MLRYSGFYSNGLYGGKGGHICGPEILYTFIKRLQLHKKPECKILQNLETASIRWTTTD